MSTQFTAPQNPVYVFDLDGVITDPQDSQVNEEVVGHMHALLDEGGYLAVNTGRSYDWVHSNLVSRLQSRSTPEIFSRFIAACEKGGETVTWHEGQVLVKPSEFALEPMAYDCTKQVFEAKHYTLTTMFWDATKRTMATIEKKPESDLGLFHKQQQQLVVDLRQALAIIGSSDS